MLSFLKIIITELIVGNYSEPSIKIDIIINGINLLINILIVTSEKWDKPFCLLGG